MSPASLTILGGVSFCRSPEIIPAVARGPDPAIACDGGGDVTCALELAVAVAVEDVPGCSCPFEDVEASSIPCSIQELHSGKQTTVKGAPLLHSASADFHLRARATRVWVAPRLHSVHLQHKTSYKNKNSD